LSKETVISLVLAARNKKEDIWRISFEETIGAPVLFPSWAFSELSDLPQGKGGGFVAKKYPARVRTIGARDKFELMDADTPESLEFLEKHAISAK
jgi:molybdenum cofactor cytidylyltransferase